MDLEDGQQVAIPFPMVVLVEATAGQEVESTPVQEESQQPSEAADAREAEPIDATSTPPEQSSEGNDGDIAKLTVKQLQALTKKRGIGIARTKEDFLRIIKEKNPEEDLERLKGKVLFDRVSGLHIFRLRTKDDLVRILQT